MTSRTTQHKRGEPITRRRLLASIAAGSIAVAAGDAALLEPNGITTSQHELRPRSTAPTRIRIVQLTDLHLRDTGPHVRGIARRVNDLHPSVVLLTGDSIDDTRNLNILASFLDMLDDVPRKLAILGNWEYWAQVPLGALRQVYERRSCQLLINERVEVAFGSEAVVFTGLDSLVGGNPSLASMASAPSDDRGYSILLQHCPAYRDMLSAVERRRFDLMLAGHTHGGQIRLGTWAPFRPEGSGRYVMGWYRSDGAIPLYVSRGLGTSIVPLRFCAPPEIAVFDL
jgi:predicted MPP superfamily phosphohydrolase